MNSDLANKRARSEEPVIWNDEIEQATGAAFSWMCPFCGVDLYETGYQRAHIWPVGYGVGMVPGNIVLSSEYQARKPLALAMGRSALLLSIC